MRFDCADLLDSDNPGLLWVSRQGVVKHANACAAGQTGLTAGQGLYDPDLARAVASVATRGVPAEVNAMGAYCEDGRSFKELRCRVIPGTAPDDVFVIIGAVETVQRPVVTDQMLSAVRSDLGEPLRRFQAALSRCQDQAATHPIEGLLGRLEELTFAIGKVLDLADCCREGTATGKGSISAWQLLQQAWNQEQAKAIDRDVKARFHAHTAATLQAQIQGDVSELHRAMVECIDAAIMAAPAGTTLDIEHRIDATGLQIVFMDCQAFAAADEGVPTPACESFPERASPGVPDGPRMAMRELIGYNYSRHVLARHGGRLRAEQRSGTRHLVIELPNPAAANLATALM